MDIRKYTPDEITPEQLRSLVSSKTSFQVVAVRNISSVVNSLEGEIEKQGYRCRVYTEYRAGVLAGAFLNVTAPLAWISAIGVAAHNISTLNPDFEIAKNKLAGTVTVKYKK